MVRALFSFLILWGLWGSGLSYAHPDSSDLYAPPLPSQEELQEEYPTNQTVWLLLQFGDEPTSLTEEQAYQLRSMGYPVEVRTVSTQEMFENLEQAHRTPETDIYLLPSENVHNTHHLVKKWLGLFNGMAFQFALKRSPSIQLADFKAGVVTALIAGGATHFGFLSTNALATPPPYPVMAAVTMALWYGVTTYYHEWMRLFSNQGLALQESTHGRWEVSSSARFRNLSLLLKSLIQNILVFTAGHQELGVILEGNHAWKLGENSFLSMLARSLPEQLIHESLEREVHSELQGELHFKRARNLRVAYETLHIFLKTVHLFQIPYLEYGYYGLAGAGAAASLYRGRFALARKLERFINHLRSIVRGESLPNEVCEASFGVAIPYRR